MGSGVLRRFWEKNGEGSGRTFDWVFGKRKLRFGGGGGDMVLASCSGGGDGGDV